MGFDIDKHTEQAAIELKHILQDRNLISVESISKEFYKAAKTGPSLSNFLIKLQNTKILHDILPEFTTMEGFTHNPKHHPEGGSTVLGHILECLKVSPFHDPVINLAILFHDFGKAVTRGEKAGHSTYYGHEAAGVPIVENIFERLKFSELSAGDKKAILDAVDKHMLVHKLDELNLKTLSKLILSPSWNVIKSVGYCDEASRGEGLFNKQEFEEKIQRAENKVSSVGGSNENAMKSIIKKYVDGNKVLSWFPQLNKDKPKIKVALSAAEEYVFSKLEAGEEPNEPELKAAISNRIL